MHHNLLPQHLQNQLKSIAATKRADLLDAVIASIKCQAPEKFHTEKSLSSRIFFDEPKGHFSGVFIRPAPTRI